MKKKPPGRVTGGRGNIGELRFLVFRWPFRFVAGLSLIHVRESGRTLPDGGLLQEVWFMG